jgi:hypothetical protein
VTVGGVHASRTVPKGTKAMRIVFNPESQYQITQSTDGDNTVLSFPSKIEKVDIIQLESIREGEIITFYLYPTASTDSTLTFMDERDRQVIQQFNFNTPCNVSYQIQDTTPTLITNDSEETGITTNTNRRQFIVSVPIDKDNCPMFVIKKSGFSFNLEKPKKLLISARGLNRLFTDYVYSNNGLGNGFTLGNARITC